METATRGSFVPNMSSAVRSLLEVAIVRKSDEQRRVFGWGLLSRTKAGDVIVDVQGDMTEPEDMEEAAYAFAKSANKPDLSKLTDEELEIFELLLAKMGVPGLGGEMHEGEAEAELIESMAFTPEKMEALGIPEGILPVGLFVGFEVPTETFKRVRLGDRLWFSIQGRAEEPQIVMVPPRGQT